MSDDFLIDAILKCDDEKFIRDYIERLTLKANAYEEIKNFLQIYEVVVSADEKLNFIQDKITEVSDSKFGDFARKATTEDYIKLIRAIHCR